MNPIVEEIRRAYATVGITLDAPATYGTYYRLLCAGCGGMVGNTGDRLLPGMAAALVAGQADLYKKLWAAGDKAPEIALTLMRDGATVEQRVKSVGRGAFFKISEEEKK